MKTLLFLLFAVSVQAVPVTLNMGPRGFYTERLYTFPVASEYDVSFTDPVTLFGSGFEVSIVLLTDSFQGFTRGTGYAVGSAGDPLEGPLALGSASSSHFMSVGLFPIWLTGEPTPFTFSGAHFDLTLPAGAVITDARLELLAFDGKAFRVGPHVADSGSSAVLLLIVLAVLVIGQVRVNRSLHDCAHLK